MEGRLPVANTREGCILLSSRSVGITAALVISYHCIMLDALVVDLRDEIRCLVGVAADAAATALGGCMGLNSASSAKANTVSVVNTGAPSRSFSFKLAGVLGHGPQRSGLVRAVVHEGCQH